MICVTIDGPSASGKSSVSCELAKKFKFIHLDTGALYRAVAYFFLKNRLDFTNSKIVENNLKGININVDFIENTQNVFLNDENITDLIRTNEVSLVASQISAFHKVREFLLETQRNFSKTQNLIADGRDMGTVVFPNADLKFFLTASPKIRAERRYKELLSNGDKVNFNEIFESTRKRDLDDSTRTISPLVPAADAIIFDNSAHTLEETTNHLGKIISEKLGVTVTQ